jgi:hypothetical protein
MSTDATCKLSCILAREAPIAAILRSGPSDWVQLIQWNLTNDTFVQGQWFHGRIYSRRSDLSPDGTKFLYFAAKFQDSTYDATYTSSWTAVSKLPWLTAIALWPKGDFYAGGGLFHDNNHIWLNHRPERAKAHTDHQPPKELFVNPNPFASGEDYPIYANRLERDGWRYTQHGDFRLRNGEWITQLDERCVKSDTTRRFELEMTLTGIKSQTPGASFVFKYMLRDVVNQKACPVDADNWADWDRSGRLLFSKDGQLFAAQPMPGADLDPRRVADFTGNKFEEVKSPASALVW